jgi:hypothetical protein
VVNSCRIQKQCSKLAIGKKRFLPEEKELLILFKLHEKKLELAKLEKEREEQDRKVVMRVLPTVAPESTWSMPAAQLPESVWGHETSPAQQQAPRRVDSLWGDLEPIPMPHSTVASSIPTASSLWGLPTSNGLHHQRQQFTGQFDKVIFTCNKARKKNLWCFLHNSINFLCFLSPLN